MQDHASVFGIFKGEKLLPMKRQTSNCNLGFRVDIATVRLILSAV